MPNPFFQFKQFTVHHDQCSMKVTTDSCLFGAWVAHQLKELKSNNNVLDIGSGSGLLSLMVAQKTAASIEGIELQYSDYRQSVQNISATNFTSRITIHHADALRFQYDKKYDIIFSNPPFYENDLKGAVSAKNIAHHDQGLKLSDLLKLINTRLNKEGHFYLLLPEKRMADVQQLTSSTHLFINEIVEVFQTEKHQAFRIMIKGSFTKTDLQHRDILIKENNSYTANFIQLLKDYYLHL